MPLFIHTYYLADTHSSPSESRKISFLWPLLQMFVLQQRCGINPAAGEASGVPETIPTSTSVGPGRCVFLSRGSGGDKGRGGAALRAPPGWLSPGAGSRCGHCTKQRGAGSSLHP